MLFCATRRVVGHEALENEWYIVIKAYKFTVFDILRDFFLHYYILRVHTIPTYRVYQLYNI